MSVQDERGFYREQEQRQAAELQAVRSEKPITPPRYQWEMHGRPFDFYLLCESITPRLRPAQEHALKKVIRAGRGDKPLVQDIDEAIACLQRWREMVIQERTDKKQT